MPSSELHQALLPDPSDQETNPYLYAAANPCNYADPTGEDACGVVGFLAGAATSFTWAGLARSVGRHVAQQTTKQFVTHNTFGVLITADVGPSRGRMPLGAEQSQRDGLG